MTYIGCYNCVNAFGIYTPKSNCNRCKVSLTPSFPQVLSVSLSPSQPLPTRKKRSPHNRQPLLSLKSLQILLCALLIVSFCVTVHKLIDASCGINQLHLTCVEWVRCVRDFHLVHGIGFAVHLYRLFCRNGGPTQKHVVVGHILKRHQTIILRVNSLLHLCCF